MKMKEAKKLQIPTTLVYQEGREPREMAELSAVNELIAMYEDSQDQLRVICSSCPEHCEVAGSVAGTAQNYIGELEQKVDRLQQLVVDLRNCNFQGYNPDGSEPLVYAERSDGLKEIVGIKMDGWECRGPRKERNS